MKRPNPYVLHGNIGLTQHLSSPRVTLGHGALNELGKDSGGRTALVVDSYLLKSPHFIKLQNEILSGTDFEIICAVSDEPSYAAIDPFIEVIRNYKPNRIVAIGGGSTIDTAKALLVFYALPHFGWDEFSMLRPLPEFCEKVTLIAVPTTSGTGAEATGAAVYKRYDGTKALLKDQAIRPNEVFLDFDLLASIPPKVLAAAGVDALAHVIGAMSMESINNMDRMICIQVALEIIKNLPLSYESNNVESRNIVHTCAYLAGDIINNEGSGLEHKLDMFAKAYHIPHGEMIGIFLPYTMLYLLSENHYTQLAIQLGIPGDDDQTRQRKLVKLIWQIYDTLNMPKTIQETGIPEKEFLENLPTYIEMVKEIGHIYWIKGFRGDDSLKDIYLQAYYGTEIGKTV